MPAILFLLLATSWAGEAFGSWKLNPARSTLAANEKSVTLRIEPHTRGEVFTLETVTWDGRALTSSTILYFDGKARDFQDSACSGTQSSRRVDTRTVEILRECASGGRSGSYVGPCRPDYSLSKLRSNKGTDGDPSRAS